METLGQKLRRLRRANNLILDEVSLKIGVDIARLSRFERNNIALPERHMVKLQRYMEKLEQKA